MTIKAESEKSRFFVTGALLGAYAMSLPIDHWNNSPALGYLRDSPFAIALVRALLGAGSGLLVGWLADSIFHRRLASFGLDGQEAFPVEEWERLRLFLAGFGGGPSRFHLSVDAGFESAGGTKDCFRGLGPGFIYGENKPFTLFRRLRLEYSVFPAWRFGYTFASLGEAPREYWTKNCDPNLSVIQRTNGHYLTAAFTPAFRGASRNALTAALGLGGGVANVDLRTEAQYFAVSGAEERSERQEQNVNKLAPSVLVFAEAGIRLYRHLTIGLSADWAWVAAQELPAFAPALMPARRVSLSSGSLGFCLGLHI
ncbi:MAG: hypothetical protein NTZ26_12290 [Candidatus Aminicenantes bacterium]|nr:hypothetical protein [Candidatus Aminicenantes bacterium]